MSIKRSTLAKRPLLGTPEKPMSASPQASAPVAGAIANQVCDAPGERFLRIEEVVAMVALSKSSIYNRIKDNTFPRPIPLGPNRVAFLLSEVRRFMDECVAGRDK